jgi:hypothetical protein
MGGNGAPDGSAAGGGGGGGGGAADCEAYGCGAPLTGIWCPLAYMHCMYAES